MGAPSDAAMSSVARLPAPQRRFGVLGGTFDPIHIGHLIIAQEVVSALQLDRLFFYLPVIRRINAIGILLLPRIGCAWLDWRLPITRPLLCRG